MTVPGLLVDRDDTAGVQRVVPAKLVPGLPRLADLACAAGLRQHFVLRVLELQAVRRQLELAKEDDSLVRPEDVVEKRLVEPDGAERTGRVAHDQLEDLEARPARRADSAADDLADDRGRDARTKRRDRLECAAVFVADRESIEEILDGVEADALEIGGAPRADAFEELQRRLKGIYCTTIASPFPTRISLMPAGSSKGSSMLMPEGFSGDLE